jgi:monovalent cation:H+ antiporter, CPA1 family
MDESLRQVVSLLAVAMAVAIAARRLKLPYTVGLVIVGIAIAYLRLGLQFPLTHVLIFDLILPPLLFEAALSLPWGELRRDFWPIFVLSTAGTLVAAAIVVAGMISLLGWPSDSALMFGVLIAATDPVAVIALFKDSGVTGRLRLLVESESLFNDGVAAVLFAMALAWIDIAGPAQSGLDTVVTLAEISFGGIAIGAACGGMSVVIAGSTKEHLVEATLTTVAAYGSLLLAEQLHVSGVLATVTTGLILGNFGEFRSSGEDFLTSRGREFVVGFWEFAAFLANSAVFLLIGENIATTPFNSYGPKLVLVSIAIVLVSRGLTVYPLSFAFARTRWRIPLREQHVLWWGGLRGALALALALSLPPTLPLRDEIVVVTFGVVAFSIIVQGLTMPPLLRRLGFMPGEGQP